MASSADLPFNRFAACFCRGEIHLQLLQAARQFASLNCQVPDIRLNARAGRHWLGGLQFLFSDDDDVVVDLVGDVAETAADRSNEHSQCRLQFDTGQAIHVDRRGRLNITAIEQFFPHHDDRQGWVS